MISMEQIDGEINVLEQEKPTHIIMEKLANLYIVRDHMTIQPDLPSDDATVPLFKNKSEFMEVCSSKNISAVLEALDEHMEAIKLLYPKEYDSLIEKIRNL